MAGVALRRQRGQISPIPQSLPRRPLPPVAGPGLVPVATFLVFLAALLNFYLFQVSVVATSAYELDRLERERELWRASNQQIELELAKAHSLPWVEFEAIHRLGMIPANEPVYLGLDAPPAEPSSGDQSDPDLRAEEAEPQPQDFLAALRGWLALFSPP